MGILTDRQRFERRMAALLRTIESMPHDSRLIIIREPTGFRWERIHPRLSIKRFPQSNSPDEQR